MPSAAADRHHLDNFYERVAGVRVFTNPYHIIFRYVETRTGASLFYFTATNQGRGTWRHVPGGFLIKALLRREFKVINPILNQ